ESGQDLEAMLQSAGAEFGSKIETSTDEYGYEWLVVADPQAEELVTQLGVAAQTLTENGFGEQLLCVVVAVDGRDGRPCRLVYNLKRGRLSPFVQTGKERRGNARERELQSKLERELPLEPQLERWFPLYGAPV